MEAKKKTTASLLLGPDQTMETGRTFVSVKIELPPIRCHGNPVNDTVHNPWSEHCTAN